MTAPLPWLAIDNLEFPDISEALEDPNGLLAAGGDLSPARLENAYRHGIFPWYEDDQPILWWSPNPRLILKPEKIHISRSMKRLLKKQAFKITSDTAFTDVVHKCSLPRRDQAGTWITNAMKDAYAKLHKLDIAHSIEVWDKDNELVGGIYGIAIGRAFFGESMFSSVPNTSKIALITLANLLNKWDFGFIDCQMETSHLVSMGAELVSREEFKQLLVHYTEQRFEPREWSKSKLTHD